MAAHFSLPLDGRVGVGVKAITLLPGVIIQDFRYRKIRELPIVRGRRGLYGEENWLDPRGRRWHTPNF
jgi:hypothetical protein